MSDKKQKQAALIYGSLGILLAISFLLIDRHFLDKRSSFWDLIFLAFWGAMAYVLGFRISLLKEELMIDDLTKLNNYKSMQKELDRELKCASINKTCLSLLIIDIDHFKSINDSKGHLYGNQVITLLAKKIHEFFPKSSLAFRWGGEEFVLILPKTTSSEAYTIAESFRKKVEMSKQLEGITVSIGVVSSKGGLNKNDLFRKADQAMFEAKLDRNKVFNAGLVTKEDLLQESK